MITSINSATMRRGIFFVHQHTAYDAVWKLMVFTKEDLSGRIK